MHASPEGAWILGRSDAIVEKRATRASWRGRK